MVKHPLWWSWYVIDFIGCTDWFNSNSWVKGTTQLNLVLTTRDSFLGGSCRCELPQKCQCSVDALPFSRKKENEWSCRLISRETRFFLPGTDSKMTFASLSHISSPPSSNPSLTACLYLSSFTCHSVFHAESATRIQWCDRKKLRSTEVVLMVCYVLVGHEMNEEEET